MAKQALNVRVVCSKPLGYPVNEDPLGKTDQIFMNVEEMKIVSAIPSNIFQVALDDVCRCPPIAQSPNNTLEIWYFVLGLALGVTVQPDKY